MSIEKQIALLWQGAKTLNKEQHTHNMLQSYYINTCRKLAKNKLQIPKEMFGVSQMCAYCGSFWNDSEYQLNLIPKHVKNTSIASRLIENLENSCGTSKNLLSKKQRNRAKWLKKKISSHLAIKCCQCKHSSLVKMGNQKCEPRKQKKQKEKNYCSITSENLAIKCKQGSKDTFDMKRRQENNILQSSLKKKEKLEVKTSKPKNKAKPNNVASNKVVSKTQKQNSLLQLAAFLQKQSTVDLKNSTQKKLKSFLK